MAELKQENNSVIAEVIGCVLDDAFLFEEVAPGCNFKCQD